MAYQTYEVTLLLNDSARYLSLLMASTSPASAVAEVTMVLRNLGVEAGKHYDPDETKVVACHVEPA